jgi:integrase
MLGDAVRQGKIPANPAVRADLPPAQEFVGQEIRADDLAAIREALVAIAEPDPFRHGEPDLIYVYLFDVALGTGLRLGELRALAWRHVDLERRLIRVEQAYHVRNSSGQRPMRASARCRSSRPWRRVSPSWPSAQRSAAARGSTISSSRRLEARPFTHRTSTVEFGPLRSRRRASASGRQLTDPGQLVSLSASSDSMAREQLVASDQLPNRDAG